MNELSQFYKQTQTQLNELSEYCKQTQKLLYPFLVNPTKVFKIRWEIEKIRQNKAVKYQHRYKWSFNSRLVSFDEFSSKSCPEKFVK